MVENKYLILDQCNQAVFFLPSEGYREKWENILDNNGDIVKSRTGVSTVFPTDLLWHRCRHMWLPQDIRQECESEIIAIETLYQEFGSTRHYYPYYIFSQPLKQNLSAVGIVEQVEYMGLQYLYTLAQVQEIKASYARLVHLYQTIHEKVDRIEEIFLSAHGQHETEVFFANSKKINYREVKNEFFKNSKSWFSLRYKIENSHWAVMDDEVVIPYQLLWQQNASLLSQFEFEQFKNCSAPIYFSLTGAGGEKFYKDQLEVKPEEINFRLTLPSNAYGREIYAQLQNGKITQLLSSCPDEDVERMNIDLERRRLEQHLESARGNRRGADHTSSVPEFPQRSYRV